MIVVSKAITYHLLALIHSITLGEHMAWCGLRGLMDTKRTTKKGNNTHKQGMVGPRESVCVQDGDKIRQAKQSSVAKKWEAMCQQLWAVARQVGNEVGDDEDNEGFKMDEAVSHTVV